MFMYIYACMHGVLKQRAIEPSLGGSTRVALVVALGQIVGRKEGGCVGSALGEEVVAAMSVILMPARGEEPELKSVALQVEHRVHMYICICICICIYIYTYIYICIDIFVCLVLHPKPERMNPEWAAMQVQPNTCFANSHMCVHTCAARHRHAIKPLQVLAAASRQRALLPVVASSPGSEAVLSMAASERLADSLAAMQTLRLMVGVAPQVLLVPELNPKPQQRLDAELNPKPQRLI